MEAVKMLDLPGTVNWIKENALKIKNDPAIRDKVINISFSKEELETPVSIGDHDECLLKQYLKTWAESNGFELRTNENDIVLIAL